MTNVHLYIAFIPAGLIQYTVYPVHILQHTCSKKATRACKPVSPPNDLDQGELTALEELRPVKDLDLTKADRGDTVVLMTTAQYFTSHTSDWRMSPPIYPYPVTPLGK